MLARCIQLDLDCADVCLATGSVLSRQMAFDAQRARTVLQGDPALEGKPHWPTDPPSRLKVINILHIALVEEFECGVAHLQHQAVMVVLRPDLGRFQPQPSKTG